MPSREDIVQALKVASESCGAFGEHSKAKGLKDLAAQVVSMRCETCIYGFETTINKTECGKFGGYREHDHGCFAHE